MSRHGESTANELNAVRKRLDNLQVLLGASVLTPKEYNQRRDAIIDEAIDGPSLEDDDDDIVAPLKREPDEPVAALERAAGKRPLKRARLTGFQYYDPNKRDFVIADTQDVEALAIEEEDDGSSYSGASEDSTCTSSSSSSGSSDIESSSEISEEEESGSPSFQLEARDPSKLFNFVTPPK